MHLTIPIHKKDCSVFTALKAFVFFPMEENQLSEKPHDSLSRMEPLKHGPQNR